MESQKTDPKKDLWSAQDRAVIVRTLSHVEAMEQGLRNVKSVQQQPDFVFTSRLNQIANNLQGSCDQMSSILSMQQNPDWQNQLASLQNNINQLRQLESDYRNNFSWHM
ncbi:hypothetical protein OENI_20238 [Oenococcus oeni]|uniref:hypothetical protein n=1 Tax=Oenococcus oeni TaxID=1247 RepID=UPI0010B3F354|nr:hypothetical protein [Oenococcus oeni]SYW12265.1 hypothetical protein OENI_20238 [Oenococcus oeni]